MPTENKHLHCYSRAAALIPKIMKIHHINLMRTIWKLSLDCSPMVHNTLLDYGGQGTILDSQQWLLRLIPSLPPFSPPFSHPSRTRMPDRYASQNNIFWCLSVTQGQLLLCLLLTPRSIYCSAQQCTTIIRKESQLELRSHFLSFSWR